MIFNTDAKTKRFSTIAKIMEMTEGRGRALGQKMTVQLSFFSQGTLQTKKVDFWNASKKSDPQLYSRIRDLPLNSLILVTIRESENSKSCYAVDFATEYDFLRIGDLYFYFGKIANINHRKYEAKYIADLGVKNIGKRVATTWNMISYLVEDPKTFHLKTNDYVLSACKAPMERMLPNGTPIFSFAGVKYAPIQDEMEKLLQIEKRSKKENGSSIRYDLSSLPDEKISIGVYQNHPVSIRNILNVPDGQISRIIAWMNYVADEWVPEGGNQELQSQKELVIEALSCISRQKEVKNAS